MSKTSKLLAVALTELKIGNTESAAQLFASVSSAPDFDQVVSALAGRKIETSLSSMHSDPVSDHKFSLDLAEEIGSPIRL
jgi:hypothetical protein